MKKALLILFVAVASLTACKKDPEDKLQGRWNLTKAYFVESTNGTKTSEHNETYEKGDLYVVFDGNKISVYEDGELDDNGTFTATGNSITIKSNNGEEETNQLRWNSKKEFVITSEGTDVIGNTTYVYKSEMTFNKD
ncbi:hypothetical protein [Pedobacter xixiisoli]|uniref:Lipocalin-like domain-containing protein n=1 Tax=Pedobacter xixiisoli TaxID=1476464 RepID=A0A286A6A7_9SPHI|nr:hypothetical protein [Pedobacter xixiisoli]SOD17419.1 hypothetical protein SAMN06297358_2529 [Pedobacter xixiisoli]